MKPLTSKLMIGKGQARWNTRFTIRAPLRDMFELSDQTQWIVEETVSCLRFRIATPDDTETLPTMKIGASQLVVNLPVAYQEGRIFGPEVAWKIEENHLIGELPYRKK